MTAAAERVEVAIVGGGPAGAVLAGRLATAGREVVVFERSPAWHWRAGGVFASPAAVAALRRAGLEAGTLAEVTRHIPAMRVETGGTTFRLTYGAETGGPPAVGFDRSRLDPILLERAAAAGAQVRTGWTVTATEPDAGRLEVRDPAGRAIVVGASVVVGADGPHSVVARGAGVARPVRLDPRVGLTYHLADPDQSTCRDARMRVLRDGYVGIAPVPGGRVNVGIVLGRSWRPALLRDGARAIVDAIVAAIPATDEDPAAWRAGLPLDTVAGAWPLGHRVTRRAGERWLLVGDAAGFLDPFTGEGLHRALVSAELAAAAILARHRGGATSAFAAYERAMQRRFLAKDAVSWLVQAFLGRPALFDYAARRVAARPAVRATMGLVMGDLVPAGRALDPRFLAALLAP
jgi:flavin-dependent dehydrogenase